MKSAKCEISDAILNWVKQLPTFEYIGEKEINIVNEWISHSKIPTYNQIKILSEKLRIPFGYFFLDEPPKEEMKILKFRTIKNETADNVSRELIDTINHMEEIQNWAREYMINSGFGSLNIVGIYKDNFDINYIAKGARETLGLDIHWYENYKDADSVFKFIRKALEKIGIFVLVNGKVKNNTHRPLSLNEFRAFSLIDDYAPLIFINGKDTKNGKVFSLIHEYIHILIGIENLLNDKYGSFYNESINNNDLHVNDQYKKIELLCNAVTSEILVPSEIFCNRWDKSNEIIRNIETLSKYFNCSKFVITIKAFKEKMIDYKTYSQIYKKLIDEYEDIIGKKTKSSGGDFYNASSFGIDHRFFKMLNQSVFEGNTTYTYAFHLTNFSSKTFFEMEKKIMGGSQ